MRSALRSFAALFLAVAVVTCVDSPVAPSSGAGSSGGRASIAFAPRFSAGAAQAGVVYDLNGLLVNQVHVVVTLNGQTLADTSVAYSATDSSFSLALNVAANPGDEVAFSLQYLSGTTVLYSGSGTATTFAVGGTAPANPTPVVLVAVGPGATAAHVTVTPSAGSFPTTAPIPFGATVTDANNTAIAGALLSWTVSDPTLATIGATTGLLQPTGKRGTVTVSASTLNGVTGTAVIALVPPPAKLVVISGSGQTGAAGAALAQPVIVQVQAADGIGASGQTVAFSLSGGTGTGANAGSVSPATLTTDANGNASATVTLGTTAGTYMLTATSGTFTAPATETATAANVATLTLVSGSGQTDSVKQQLPAPLVVKAADQFGNPKSGVGVTWARTAGSGTPSATSTTTGADGTTSVTYTFGAAVGTETIAASAAGVTSPIAFSETATTGGAATITAVLGNGQLAAIGVALGIPLTVRVVDAGGNPVTGAHVTWTITNGTLATSQATTDATGQATATVVTGQTTGPLTVTAALVTGTSVQFSETVTSGLPAVVRFTGNPSNVTSGAAITPAVQVTVTDAGGNPVTIVSPSVTLTLTGGTIGAVLSGTLTQPTVNGVATFSNLSVNLAGSGYAVVATVSGLTPAPSATFTVSGAVVGVATQIASNGGSVTGTVHMPVATPPSVIVKDVNGNPVAGVAVTFAVASGGGAITGAAQTTSASGIATVGSWTLGIVAGTNTLTATSAGLAGSPVTFTAAGVADVASALFFTVQPSGAATSTVITPAVQVTARDAFGNTATTFTGAVTVNLTTNPGGATLSGTLTVAAVAGVATFSTLSLNQSGAGYVMGAAASLVTTTVSAPFTITPGAAQTIQWTNASGGSWSNPANWNLNRVPVSTDSVVIAAAGTYTVTLDTTFTGKYITVGGGTGLQTLSISSRTLTMTNQFTINSTGAFTMTNSALAGISSVSNQGTLTLAGATIVPPVMNQGTMIASSTSTLSALTTQASSTINVAQIDGSSGLATLAVGGSFTNSGTIQLTNQFTSPYGSSLIVTGTLTNAPGGHISVLGGQTPGGSRTINAQLNNQGTFTANVPLTINPISAAHINSGAINANATLTLTQSGTSPSFTNSGTIGIAGGQGFVVNGGTFTQQGGGVVGTGTLTLNAVTMNLSANFTNANAVLAIPNSTINGPGTLTNATGQTLTLVATTITAPVTNQGTLIASGSSSMTGGLTTAAGSTLEVAQVDGTNGVATLTVGTAFTNNGELLLSNAFASPYGATLVVTGGSLTNAPAGAIWAVGGQTPGGARTLTASLTNQGTVTVVVPLTINAVSAAHMNTASGTFNANASVTLNQSGTTPSFTNAGALSIGSGQSFVVNSGTFTYVSGAVTGAGTLTVSSGTMTLNGNFTDANVVLTVPNSTINGTGTLTNATGQSLTLVATTISAPVVNQGTLIASGSSSMTGGLTTTAGSTMEVAQVDGSTGVATLTMGTAFTNNGAIQLTNAFSSAYGATLIVTGGSLTNAAAGTISAIGGQTPGGARTLTAPLTNQGTLTVSVPLTINAVNATHVNSGTINVSAALTLNQTGGSPTFINSGALTIASGQTFVVNTGTFTYTGGAITGMGTLTLSSVTMNLTANFTDANILLTVPNCDIVGAGPLTNAAGQTLTLVGTTLNAPVVNQGTLIASGSSVMTGGLTTTAASTLEVAQVDGSTGVATLTINTGLTNNGAIQLTNAFSSAYAATLIVSGGELVNAASGIISVIGGQTPGGARTITTQISNQGTLNVNVPLTINSPFAIADSNGASGTINVNAALTLNQVGALPTFTNSGNLVIAAGQTFAVNDGIVNYVSGGVSGTGTWALNTTTINLKGNYNNPNAVLAPTNSVINGPDTLTIANGQTLTLASVTVNAAVTNLGTLIASSTSNLNGGLTTGASSTLEVAQVDGSAGTATLTIGGAGGLTNTGTIALSSAFTSATGATLIMTGPLTNAVGGTISVLGGQTPGGTRTLTGNLDNLGTLTVFPDVSGGSFSMTGSLTFESTSTFDLVIGGTLQGTTYDRVSVNVGSITINGGTLNATLVNSFTPGFDAPFMVLLGTFANSNSTPFTTTNLPAVRGPWSIQYNAGSIVLVTNGGLYP